MKVARISPVVFATLLAPLRNTMATQALPAGIDAQLLARATRFQDTALLIDEHNDLPSRLLETPGERPDGRGPEPRPAYLPG